MSTLDPPTHMPPLVEFAPRAMKQAVAGVILEHRRTRQPLVVWQDGRTTLVDPDTVPLPDAASNPRVHEPE